jgi:hypothetical protein
MDPDPDPGGPKTCASGSEFGSGPATLAFSITFLYLKPWLTPSGCDWLPASSPLSLSHTNCLRWSAVRLFAYTSWRQPSLYQSCGSAFISSGSGSNTDPYPIRIQGFNDKKLKKITAEKKITFFYQNYNLPIPRPP